MSEKFILLVDDNPETRQLLTYALSDAGLSVKAAKNVLGAVEMLHCGDPVPDLIITDLVMPQTTGWDLLAHLRDDALLRHVPVMVVTGADPTETPVIADVVLQKPLDPFEVVRTARRLMGLPPQL
ncbi:MAG: response regulator [Vicinamibacterales bacterium]